MNFNLIFLITIFTIILSFIVYSFFIQKKLVLPSLENNIKQKKYYIFKSVGLSLIITLPLLAYLVFKNKKILKEGINKAIRI